MRWLTEKQCYMDLKTKFRGQNGMIAFRLGCYVVRMNC